MIHRLAFVGIVAVASIVSLGGAPAFAGNVIAQVTSTPTPPLFIPAWILGGGAFYHGQQPTANPVPSFNDVDPGGVADQTLFGGALDAGPTPDSELGINCPGIGSGGSNHANCNPYFYVDMLDLHCTNALETAAYDHLNGTATSTPDETGFLHYTPTPAPRITDEGQCPGPTPTPGPSAGYFTNPDDSGFQSWLVANAWNTTNFPVPFGIYEDRFSVLGDPPCHESYEYGPGPCNTPSNSPHDWETALGDFEDKTCSTPCFAFVGNGLTPGGGGNTGPCNNINMTRKQCWAIPDAGIVDDMDALDNLCGAAASASNLRAILAEEIVFLKGNVTTGTPMYANPQTIVYMINTMSHLVNYTTGGCAHTVAIDAEAAGGSFYPLNNYTAGSVAQGIQVRMEATALRFLVPDLATLVPDRMQPFYFTIGGTNNNWSPTADNCSTSPYCEVAYTFEETLVPQGPEKTVGAFSWNGSTASVGDGCPTPNPGDMAGAVDLMVTCVSSSPDDPPAEGAAVFVQEYHHLYIAGRDYGPAAVLLNTASATSAAISSTWFCLACDPIGHFHYQLAITTGELPSVTTGVVSIPLPCTQSTYCNGDDTVTGNTASFDPSHPGMIGPDSGMILLGSN